jgi:hypothetical protein
MKPKFRCIWKRTTGPMIIGFITDCGVYADTEDLPKYCPYCGGLVLDLELYNNEGAKL